MMFTTADYCHHCRALPKHCRQGYELALLPPPLGGSGSSGGSLQVAVDQDLGSGSGPAGVQGVQGVQP